MNDLRGSNWRKWDLHIHTPESVLNNQFGSDWDVYAKKVFELAVEKEICAIGVTDYFDIEGYKKLKRCQEDNLWLTKAFGSKGKDFIDQVKSILLLPNIEFRVSETISIESKKENGEIKRESKRINLHVILSNELTPDDIEEYFLHELKFAYENEPQERSKYRSLRIPNLEDLGRRLKEEHTKFSGQSDLYVGMYNAVVIPGMIGDVLSSNSKFDDKYLVVLAEEWLSLLDWDSQDHQTRKLLLQGSNAIFSSNTKTRQWALGEMHDKVEDFITEFKSLKPCLWGSDAHEYERLFEPDNHSYSWIKADVTFGGFKQVVYEPEERVAIQPTEPDRKMPDEFIESVRFIDIPGRGVFPAEPILLNRNLNAIVGGKSSGKTLLLYYVASTLQPDLMRQMIDEGIVPKIYYDKTPDGFDFEVKWADGRIDRWSSLEEVNRRNITYIPQFYINKLAEESQKEILRKIIYDIILERSSSKKEYVAAQDTIERLNGELDSLITELFQIRNQWANILAELNKQGDKDGKKKSLENELKRITALRKSANLSQAEQDNYAKLTDEKEIEYSKSILLNKRKDEIGKWIELVETEDTTFKQNIQDLLELAWVNFDGEDPLLKFISTWSEASELELQASLVNIKKPLMDYSRNLEEEMKKSLVEIAKKDELLKPLNEKIKNRKAFDEAELIVAGLKEQIKSIESMEDEGKKAAKQFKDTFAKIVSLYDDLFSQYKSLFKIFDKPEEKSVSKMMSIEPMLTFDIEQFDEEFMVTVNRNFSISPELSFDENKEYKYSPESHVESMRKLADAVLRQSKGLIRLKDKENVEDAFRRVFRDYFKIGFEIKSGEDDLFAMSPGKRGIVLLHLFVHLSNADYPIIIDQSEDNLDNRSIYDQLCKFLREKKKKRQIIVVSHNPNLVVSTDSEEVIVCNRSGEQANRDNVKYQFEYKSGALENSFKNDAAPGTLNKMGIREHVCEVLEGGEKAFELREKKYGLY